MNSHLISYYIGIITIFLFAITIIRNSPNMTITISAYFIIFGEMCIAYYFMNKEKFIRF